MDELPVGPDGLYRWPIEFAAQEFGVDEKMLAEKLSETIAVQNNR